MTCAKGESNAFVLALQGGRRCVQYISPAARPYQALWEDAMTTCNKRGGYSVHLYNSIDVEKVGKWIPTVSTSLILDSITVLHWFQEQFSKLGCLFPHGKRFLKQAKFNVFHYRQA